MSDCLTRGKWTDFVAGRLAPQERAWFEQHAIGCEPCAAQLESARKIAAEPATIIASPPFTVEQRTQMGESLPAGTLVGRYSLLGRLGPGEGSTAFSAFDPELNRKVVIRLLRSDTRELGEAQALARFTHPNVVPIYDVGRFLDRVFVVTAQVEGRTLREWLREAPRGVDEVLRLFQEAGAGLAAAHGAGFLHRDFTPDHVFVANDGRVLVTGFEVAGTPNSAGTPGYIAPEEYRSRPVDHRADQFAFCVSLFEALFGHRPFPGYSPAEVRAAVLTGRMIEPHAAAQVPNRVRRVVLRGLSQDPKRRFASLRDLLNALREDRSAERDALATRVLIAIGLGAIAVAVAVLASK